MSLHAYGVLFLAVPLHAFVLPTTVRAPNYRCYATLNPETLWHVPETFWPSLEPATTLLAKSELQETTALPIALGVVFSVYALALVVTVPDENVRPPPADEPPPALSDAIRSLGAIGRAGGDDAAREDATPPLSLALRATRSPSDVARASIFQWRVFTLEKGSAVETMRRQGTLTAPNPPLELLRTALKLGQTVLSAARYEGAAAEELSLSSAPTTTLAPPAQAFPGRSTRVSRRGGRRSLRLVRIRIRVHVPDCYFVTALRTTFSCISAARRRRAHL